ncbi:DgyrCDS9138 [Dimorphilus gyrociliatus]|uniref:DgyrCDS9138 n=1 Tax=Dimorphilus gyrociliatus TaxID=2664684 RepID=A0A7I8VWI4_9ANNE|nr:DgyrCDS9138 [Dimorphilus gyrociliatus]
MNSNSNFNGQLYKGFIIKSDHNLSSLGTTSTPQTAESTIGSTTGTIIRSTTWQTTEQTTKRTTERTTQPTTEQTTDITTILQSSGINWIEKIIMGNSYYVSPVEKTYVESLASCLMDNYKPFFFQDDVASLTDFIKAAFTKNTEHIIFLNDKTVEGQLEWSAAGEVLRSDLRSHINGKISNSDSKDCITALKQVFDMFFIVLYASIFLPIDSQIAWMDGSISYTVVDNFGLASIERFRSKLECFVKVFAKVYLQKSPVVIFNDHVCTYANSTIPDMITNGGKVMKIVEFNNRVFSKIPDPEPPAIRILLYQGKKYVIVDEKLNYFEALIRCNHYKMMGFLRNAGDTGVLLYKLIVDAKLHDKIWMMMNDIEHEDTLELWKPGVTMNSQLRFLVNKYVKGVASNSDHEDCLMVEITDNEKDLQYNYRKYESQIFYGRISNEQLDFSKFHFLGYSRSRLDCIKDISTMDCTSERIFIIFETFSCLYSNTSVFSGTLSATKYRLIQLTNTGNGNMNEFQTTTNKMVQTTIIPTTQAATTITIADISKEHTQDNVKYILVNEILDFQAALDQCYLYNYEPFFANDGLVSLGILLGKILEKNVETWIFIDDISNENTFKWWKLGSTMNSQIAGNLNTKPNNANDNCVAATKPFVIPVLYVRNCGQGKKFICQKNI